MTVCFLHYFTPAQAMLTGIFAPASLSSRSALFSDPFLAGFFVAPSSHFKFIKAFLDHPTQSSQCPFQYPHIHVSLHLLPLDVLLFISCPPLHWRTSFTGAETASAPSAQGPLLLVHSRSSMKCLLNESMVLSLIGEKNGRHV